MGYIINGMYGDLFLISLFFFLFVLHLLADAADRLASCVSGLSFTRVFVCVCVCVVSVGSRCEPTCVCVCVESKLPTELLTSPFPLPYVSRSREMFRLREYDTYARQWRPSLLLLSSVFWKLSFFSFLATRLGLLALTFFLLVSLKLSAPIVSLSLASVTYKYTY